MMYAVTPRGALGLAVVAVLLLSGCFSSTDIEAADLPVDVVHSTLEHGWSHEAPGGEFLYERGWLKGNIEGDQIVLRINNTKPLVLEDLTWSMSGEVPKDALLTRMVVAWEDERTYPSFRLFMSEARDLLAVETEIMGLHVNQTVDWYPPTFDRGEYSVGYRYLEPIPLPPGNWSLWFAVAQSYYMDFEIKLPEGITLLEPPLFSRGCQDIRAADFDSEFMVGASVAYTVTKNARWSFELPEDSRVVGTHFGGNGFLPNFFMPGAEWEWRHEFPGETRTYEWSSTGGAHAEPPDWNGRTIASTTPGEHTFEVVREQGFGTGPSLHYCII